MNMRRRRREPRQGREPADARVVETWEAEDFDGLDDDASILFEMETGLPLRAENYVTGEPLVTVDYFRIEAARRAAIAERLLGLEGAVADEGATLPRILLFDGHPPDGTLDVRDLIAILTVRRTVESALGAGVRHLRRVAENPVDEYLER